MKLAMSSFVLNIPNSSLIFLCFFGIICSAIPDSKFVKLNCSDTKFTPNSTYATNLSNLLSSFVSNTTTSNPSSTGLFSDTAIGHGDSTVYGQFLCRGDYTVDKCNDCVVNAIRLLSSKCQSSKSAYIWIDDCTVSYSNLDFFGIYDESSDPLLCLKNAEKVAANETELMAAFTAATIGELAKQVASVNGDIDEIQISSIKYFGTKAVNFTGSNPGVVTTFYEMAQCMPDLSVEDCSSCLRLAITQLPKCCKGRLGGRLVSRSCGIRYETYRFYNETSPIIDSSRGPPSVSDFTSPPPSGVISIKVMIAIMVPVAILLVLSTIGVGFYAWKTKKKNFLIFAMDDDDFDTAESLQYGLEELKSATNNFSDANKIGQGGFGSVYKGILPSGQEIAVKKLFKSSGQVEEEFKNEAEVVAKLQHRNLVRLLGFCLAGDEKLLVFEYVPNKSLDKLLFGAVSQGHLDWLTRFKIIVGIARGLLYLHEESRLRIVHRDLKPGNILLDGNMNPKIADFGMARIFGLKASPGGASRPCGTLQSSGMDPTHQSTRRGGGTPGYMAPECAERRQFSVKTDVYSFGVLILEIISGKRNSCFYVSGLADDLLSYAWMQWKAGTPFSLIDTKLMSSNFDSSEEMRDQVLTCIHLALLCVQRDANARPTMATIVQILNFPSNNDLPGPQPPSFFVKSRSISMVESLNECSDSELDPR